MASRREFLAVAAGVAVGSALSGATPTASGRVRARPAGATRIRMSLKFGMIGAGETVRDKFEIAAEAGFEGVELDSPGDLDVGEVLRAREAAGIEIPGVVDSAHWNKPLSDPDEAVRAEGRRALVRAIGDCEAWGGTTVLLVPGVVNGGVTYGEAWDRSLGEIRAVAPRAREAGVTIAIENVWNNFLLGPIEAREYLDSLRDDADEAAVVGWYLDIGNIWHYGWPEHWIETLGKRILRLDVKGYSRAISDREGKWAGFGVEIGDGDVPWSSVNKALDRIGYRGWATAEVRGGDLERLKEIRRRMDDVFSR